jgi:undecaprenyl-diphosphatase
VYQIKTWVVLFFLSVLSPLFLWAVNEPNKSEKSAQEVRNEFTAQRAIVTGLVEGVTEYLPVSSTGHMIISNTLMGVDNSSTIKVVNVVDRKGKPLTSERIADDYIVIIQLGAILAVVFIFYQRLKSILVGIIHGNKNSINLAVAIIIAFLPAAVIGFLIKDYIPLNIEIVAIASD